ncbi:MAG: hypothetical protein V5A44_13300 [Haloarculaceae archaeon]
MDRSGVFVAAVVAVIVTVAVVSGPAVGLVDLTTRPLEGVGQGSATVDDVEAPETARFDRGLAADSYVLTVPDARVHVAAIEGRPLVSYELSIPAMGYSRTTTHFLRADDTGWVALSLESNTFPPGRIDQSSYEGELSLVLRVDDTERELYRGPVTVEVTE